MTKLCLRGGITNTQVITHRWAPLWYLLVHSVDIWRPYLGIFFFQNNNFTTGSPKPKQTSHLSTSRCPLLLHVMYRLFLCIPIPVPNFSWNYTLPLLTWFPGTHYCPLYLCSLTKTNVKKAQKFVNVLSHSTHIRFRLPIWPTLA